MDNSHRMAKVEGFEQLKEIEPDIGVDKGRVQGFEVRILDVLEDQRRRP